MVVPELLVKDLGESQRFWCSLCGFSITHDRPEEGLVLIQRDCAQVMLEEVRGPCRKWLTRAHEWPLEHGINFKIKVDRLAPILKGLVGAGWPLFMPCEEKWYRSGSSEIGQRQFIVQDPDGYLVRFAQPLGVRRSSQGT